MSVTLTDPELVAALRAAGDDVELKDMDGRTIGRMFAEGMGLPKPGMKSPFTDEELAELKKEKTGRPLADILRDLQKRG